MASREAKAGGSDALPHRFDSAMNKDRLEELFRNAPIAKSMKASLRFDPEGSAGVTLEVRPEHLQATGVAHGSVIAFVADTSAWFTAAAAAESPLTTASFTLSFLRPAQAGDTLLARSSIVKAGRSLVVVRTQVTSREGALLAEGLFTHALLPERPVH